MIDKKDFATNYSLQAKTLSSVETKALNEESFLKTGTKRTILGGNGEVTLEGLYSTITSSNILNALFDVSLDFGDLSDEVQIVDEDLLTAYTYTAYSKLFRESIEPIIGKGKVYGVIHGGDIAPYLQIIFLENEKVDVTQQPGANLAPVQQAIVDFMHVTYPNYVTTPDKWVELEAWSGTYRVAPLQQV